MNSAPNRTKSAATESRDEIRNSAECTALRAMTVKSPARIAASEKIQKKTDSQPERIMITYPLGQESFSICHLTSFICHLLWPLALSMKDALLLVQMKNDKCAMTDGKFLSTIRTSLFRAPARASRGSRRSPRANKLPAQRPASAQGSKSGKLPGTARRTCNAKCRR